MGVPISHHTRSRRNKGRSHMALKKIQLVNCRKCHKPNLPHQICLNCGFYNDREIIDVLAKLTKKERKKKEKELKAEKEEKTETKS